MNPPPPDLWFHALLGALALGSLATWLVLLGREPRWPVLAYEPRRPVPWNFVGPLLVLLLVVHQISVVVTAGGGTANAPADPEQIGQQILFGTALQAAAFATLLAVVAILSDAKFRDLGLPVRLGELARDLRLGAVLWLAAVLPVYTLQGVLVSLLGEPSSHPLIESVMEEPSGPLLLVAFVAAVLVAPVFEELAFRVLLQGWLEKVEDRWLGWRVVATTPAANDANEVVAPAAEEMMSVSEPTPANDITNSPARGLAGLPYGWTPILISSLTFALAHVGHGPDPIALFLLAVMLGYVYQRTHRVVPCIAAHLLFNLTTLVMLVLALGGGVLAE